MKIGSTTLPLAGWLADPNQPALSRERRLAAMRSLVLDHELSAVELTLDLAFLYPEIFDAAFYESVASLQRELDFVCTVHLPFLWTDPSSLNEPVRKASADSVLRAVDLTAPIDVEVYVLHLWGPVTSLVARELRQREARAAILAALRAQASRSLERICARAGATKICVENLEDGLFVGMMPVVEACGASICLDIGHLAYTGHDPVAFAGQYADRIREIHMHDATAAVSGEATTIRDHLALGEGKEDWAALLTALMQRSFAGPVIVENNSEGDLRQSLSALRALGTPGFRPSC